MLSLSSGCSDIEEDWPVTEETGLEKKQKLPINQVQDDVKHLPPPPPLHPATDIQQQECSFWSEGASIELDLLSPARSSNQAKWKNVSANEIQKTNLFELFEQSLPDKLKCNNALEKIKQSESKNNKTSSSSSSFSAHTLVMDTPPQTSKLTKISRQPTDWSSSDENDEEDLDVNVIESTIRLNISDTIKDDLNNVGIQSRFLLRIYRFYLLSLFIYYYYFLLIRTMITSFASHSFIPI